ncbi:MAG: hypothetical protein SGJ20_05195, partial [Planctomycetota bacterium]|nr:hypothetical protein [Planctomycetota bacterium]
MNRRTISLTAVAGSALAAAVGLTQVPWSAIGGTPSPAVATTETGDIAPVSLKPPGDLQSGSDVIRVSASDPFNTNRAPANLAVNDREPARFEPPKKINPLRGELGQFREELSEIRPAAADDGGAAAGAAVPAAIAPAVEGYTMPVNPIAPSVADTGSARRDPVSPTAPVGSLDAQDQLNDRSTARASDPNSQLPPAAADRGAYLPRSSADALDRPY